NNQLRGANNDCSQNRDKWRREIAFLWGVTMMSEIIQKLRGDDIIVLVLVAGGLLTAIIAIIAICWMRVRNTDVMAALKQDMLSRGMSSAEIQAVLEAGSSGGRRTMRREFHRTA
ncbi:MAG: hypothetical protein ACRD36_06060, partial [Candidatus Acidiferrum sp.]